MDRPALRAKLLAFYDRARRDLPWRRTVDPYAVWVSEVMLQQTRVDTVVPYYLRWMERFPDLFSLADADEEEVLGLWKGLGYYSRARNLHRAARVVREEYHGRLPEEPGALRALPGIGDYTAGAIASIAYQRPEPVVDGNVRRVLSRLLDLESPMPSELRGYAAELVDPVRPGDFNQALMELGATICSPTSPGCDSCPWEVHCLSRERGTVALRPPVRPRGPIPSRIFQSIVVVSGGSEEARILLRKRPAEGLLAGMWEFPAVEVSGEGELELAVGRWGASLVELLPDLPGLGDLPDSGGVLDPLGLEVVRHTFSHFRAEYRPVLVSLQNAPSADSLPSSYRLVTVEEAEAMPLPVAQQVILARARRALGDS